MQISGEAEILTVNQRSLLQVFGACEISKYFYLTGGTALSAFYLHHRFSEDLDFFTNDKRNIEEFRKEIHQILSLPQSTLQVVRSFESFIEARVTMNDGEVIKMDFAFDSPFRHQSTVKSEPYNVWIDNLLDIGCNKFSALFDRADTKDFVDMYFLLKEQFTFEELWRKAKEKHVGMDEYWLTHALKKVFVIKTLPKMVKPLTVEELQNFFLHLHDEVAEKL